MNISNSARDLSECILVTKLCRMLSGSTEVGTEHVECISSKRNPEQNTFGPVNCGYVTSHFVLTPESLATCTTFFSLPSFLTRFFDSIYLKKFYH